MVATMAGTLAPGGPRVGPNAIIQMAHALEAAGGPALAWRIFECAGLAPLLARPPEEMVPEATVARLNATVLAQLPGASSAALLREAGLRTGDYILAHRIPRPAQWLLRCMPAALAAPVLMKAVARHAWTFAGSGAVRIGGGARPWIAIAANPLAQPGCPWHGAVFERLFRRLVAAGCTVTHPRCCARGDADCLFEIRP